MREFCLDCTTKHLGQAYVLHGVIGHLAEASEECMGASPELADKIRQYRLLILESIIAIMDEETDVDVPYFDLFEDVVDVMREKGCGNCKKAEDSFKDRLKKKKSETA